MPHKSQRRRGKTTIVVAAAVAVVLLAGAPPQAAHAHAGLAGSDPAAGANLGAGPTAIRLSFSEQTEPTLAEVELLDESGAVRGSGQPEPAEGDPLTLVVPVQRLGRGVYSVEYRVVSAVDGHATTGSLAFGVRAAPASAATETTQQQTSPLEVLARWLLLCGLAVLLGAAVGGAAGFGGQAGTNLRLAAGGWMASVAGLALLVVAQRRDANSSLADLLDTSIGEALVWRAVAIAAAGGALLLARRLPRARRFALFAAAGGALGAIVAHVGAGHAAAGGWASGLTISLQVTHFAAAGIWVGGLAALLLGFRGAPAAARAAAVRRFAAVAAAALALVVIAGTVRAIDELPSWAELTGSAYGRAVLAKVALLGLIVALATVSRRHAAAADPAPFRRTSRVEISLGIGALAVAALLGTLAPPAPGQPAAAPGLSVAGADPSGAVRVELAAASDQPGPNRFTVEVEDGTSGEPLSADRVRLRFTPVDDPGVGPTTLSLQPRGAGVYTGSGSNLRFDGRWEITVLIEHEARTLGVPLALELPIPEQPVSVVRLPGRPPEYTMPTLGGYIRLSPDPERPGPSTVRVACYTVLENEAPVEDFVLTTAIGDHPPTRQPVRRLGPGTFATAVDFEPGPVTIVVVARTRDGERLRGAFGLQIPPT